MAEWSEKLKDTWWTMRRNKTAKVVGLVTVGVIVLGVIGFAIYKTYYAHPNQTTSTSTTSTTTTTTTVDESDKTLKRRRLDGMMVPGYTSNLTPIAVMVENLVSIRPQSGLSQASVVYEALAEGGITRFMAVYANIYNGSDTIPQIGPVRSARPYYVDWAEEYHGVYAYVGGSPEALGITGSSQFITDLNQFYNGQYYYRDPAIEAPHNLFTTSQNIQLALQDHKLAAVAGQYTSYQYKDDAVVADRPTSTTPLQIDYSSSDYAVEWRYQPDSNTYLRWDGGQPHLDKNTNAQLSAKNIIVQKVSTTLTDPDTERLDMTTVGSGDAILFQDGQTKTGHWSKTQRGDRTLFTDQSGNSFNFNAGTTWIEVVPTTIQVTY